MPEDKTQGTTAQETIANAAEAAKGDNNLTQDSPYFEYVLPDGKRETYQTKEELAKAWQQSRFMQSDYTRKTQEVAQQRKQHEEAVKKFQEEQKAFLEARKRYDTWDEKLKMRPDIQRQLEQLIDQPESPSVAFERSRGYVDERAQELQAKVEAIEKQLAEANSKKEIEEAFANLKAKYSDADEAAIMEQLSLLSSGEINPLLEQLYYARKGQLTPAQVEQKVVENLQKKEAAKMVPPSAAHKAPAPKFKTTDEGRAQAFKDFGLDTGG